MVTEYKVTFEKLSVAKLMTIFCWALPPKNQVYANFEYLLP